MPVTTSIANLTAAGPIVGSEQNPIDQISGGSSQTFKLSTSALAAGMAYGSSGAAETASGLYNISAITLPHWRAAVARVRSGTGRGRLVVISDSTSTGAGAGSGGSTNTNNAYSKSWVTQLSKLLSVYVPTNDNSFLGDQNIVGSGQQTNYNTYDPRVTVGGGWSVATGIGGLGANFYSCGSTGTVSFTPSGSIDSVTVWYTLSPGLGSFTNNFDGGSSVGTINQNGTAGYTSTTYTATAGTHTFNMVWSSGTLYLSGALAYLSTTPAIDFYHSGWFSAFAAQFNNASTAYAPLSALPIVAPDLTIICLTINDSNASIPISTYTANIQAIITAAKLTGDCLLMVGAPSNSTQATNGTLATYVTALKGLAVLNNCGLIDISARWVSYAVTNPLMPYSDTLHPGAMGYQDIAQAVCQVLSAP